MSFKTVGVLPEDKKRLKDLSKKLGLKEYEVVKILLDNYEKLEVLQHYLGCESIEHLFHEIEKMLPKSKKQIIIAKTNRYLDELDKLGIPLHVLEKLRETIYPIILNGGIR